MMFWTTKSGQFESNRSSTCFTCHKASPHLIFARLRRLSTAFHVENGLLFVSTRVLTDQHCKGFHFSSISNPINCLLSLDWMSCTGMYFGCAKQTTVFVLMWEYVLFYLCQFKTHKTAKHNEICIFFESAARNGEKIVALVADTYTHSTKNRQTNNTIIFAYIIVLFRLPSFVAYCTKIFSAFESTPGSHSAVCKTVSERHSLYYIRQWNGKIIV